MGKSLEVEETDYKAPVLEEVMGMRRQTSIKVDPIAWNAAKIIFKEYNLTVDEVIYIDVVSKLLNGIALDKKYKDHFFPAPVSRF